MLIPFQPAAPFISFLACHEQSIVIKPVALFLDEPVKAFLQFLIIIAISEEFLICCFQDMLLPGDQCSIVYALIIGSRAVLQILISYKSQTL